MEIDRFRASLRAWLRPLRGVIRRIDGRIESNPLSFEKKINAAAIERPAYGFCLYYDALLGKRLGYPRVSALEFGVAGGNGLLALESYAREIESELQIEIELYGFDSGAGLPEPRDYRDIPYVWRPGFYPMDEVKLRSRLNRSFHDFAHREYNAFVLNGGLSMPLED